MLGIHDEVSLAMHSRLVELRIAAPEPAQSIDAAEGDCRNNADPARGERSCAVVLHGHIELWTIETLRSAVTTPLTEII